MTLGTSIFLVAVGAVLRYAVSVQGDGFDIGMIGAILMIAGVVGAVLSFVMLAAAKDDVPVVSGSKQTIIETEQVR